MLKEGQIIEPGSNASLDIPLGIRTTLNINVPYKFIVETIGGTIIEGSATPGAPLIITAAADIKSVKAIIGENAFMPIHLVKKP